MEHDPKAKEHFEKHAEGHKKTVEGQSDLLSSAIAVLTSRAKQCLEIGDVMVGEEHKAIDVKYGDWVKGINEALKADIALLEAAAKKG